MSDRKLIEVEHDGRTLALYGRSTGDLELFIEGIHGVSFAGTQIKLNLYTTVPFLSDDKREHREVVARLVMSPHTLVTIAQFLSQRVDDLVKIGAIQMVEERREPAGPSAVSPPAAGRALQTGGSGQ